MDVHGSLRSHYIYIHEPTKFPDFPGINCAITQFQLLKWLFAEQTNTVVGELLAQVLLSLEC